MPDEFVAAADAIAPRPHYPRSFAMTEHVLGLERIFDDGINVVVWRRGPDARIRTYLDQLAFAQPLEVTAKVAADTFEPAALLERLPRAPGCEVLATDLKQLVEIFATLADSRQVGVRMGVTRRPSCPRFHVDHVSMRLVCTWRGTGTQWLEHQSVNRRFLGLNSAGVPDGSSGLIKRGAQIHEAREFDLVLLKGEAYPDNLGRGAVHRSPAADPDGGWRVTVTLDDID